VELQLTARGAMEGREDRETVAQDTDSPRERGALLKRISNFV
jgi:hypothetical protein